MTEQSKLKVALVDWDEDLFSPCGWEAEMIASAGIAYVHAQQHTPAEVLAFAHDADVVLQQSLRPLLTGEVIAALDRCRCLVRLGIGYDNVDVAAATRRGMLVCNVPAYCVEDVAEHALALLLASVRRIPRQDRWIREGRWDRTGARPARRMKGCTLGFVAFGKIARTLAERLAAFGMRLIAYDPYVDAASMQRSGVQKVDLDELLRQADFISVHAPLNAQTKHLLSTREFGLMKDGAFIVNTSRGPVIDEVALVEALRSGKVWGAGLDVMECEPLPADSALRDLDSVTFTPHVSASSEESVADLYRAACQIAIDVCQGRWPQGVVNPDAVQHSARVYTRPMLETERVRSSRTCTEELETMTKKVVTFGEIMLRLSPPGYQRFTQARSFDVVYGGGEANVAVSLANYGMAVDYVTRLPKNDLGAACIQFLCQSGVGVDKIVRGGERLGIYFLETGAAQRASVVLYDRANSSIATVERGMIDWHTVFADADWFHWTGITPAISQSLADVCLQGVQVAKEMGLTVSCDLNYRAKLWKWGKKAGEVMPELVSYCDVAVGNEEDAEKVFGIQAPATDVTSGKVEADKYRHVCEELAGRFANLKQVAVTLRGSLSASHNTWSGVLWDGGQFYTGPTFDITHIVDRVGGGDAFVGGLIYGLRTYGQDKSRALSFAIAASCLKHTVVGDFNAVSVPEVEKLMGGDASGRVAR